jgi:hypothetical protein
VVLQCFACCCLGSGRCAIMSADHECRPQNTAGSCCLSMFNSTVIVSVAVAWDIYGALTVVCRGSEQYTITYGILLTTPGFLMISL